VDLHLRRAFLQIYIHVGLFCRFTYMYGSFADLHIRSALLQIHIYVGLFFFFCKFTVILGGFIVFLQGGDVKCEIM